MTARAADPQIRLSSEPELELRLARALGLRSEVGMFANEDTPQPSEFLDEAHSFIEET